MFKQLIYPERRRMSDSDVVQWALDRRIDKALATAGLVNTSPFADDCTARIVGQVPVPTVLEAVRELQDDGVATFAIA